MKNASPRLTNRDRTVCWLNYGFKRDQRRDKECHRSIKDIKDRFSISLTQLMGEIISHTSIATKRDLEEDIEKAPEIEAYRKKE